MRALDGKAVVVTGAGKGLGRAYALHAAASGARVLVNDLDVEAADAAVAEIAASGGAAIANYDSVASWDGAAAIIADCVGGFGGIDGLVNNAGVMPTAQPWTQDEETIRLTVEVNLLGAIFCGVHAMRAMVAQTGGAIVNVTSGAQMGRSYMATYGATRSGTAALTYSWAIDGAPHGIRVNCVWPSARTGLSAQYRTTTAARQRASIPDNAPEDNGPLVTYLLSDLAEGLAGQVIMLRGGEIALVERPKVSRHVLSSVSGWDVAEIADAFKRRLLGPPDPAATPD
jgi:NAD(P)-dependent dehydrogenase (short-subunit alcohol dehydrogenase family)